MNSKIKAVVRVAAEKNSDKKLGSRRSNQHTIPCVIDVANNSINVHQETHKFDLVLESLNSNNLTVYENTTCELVDDVLEGVNCAAFTWGTPSTGKTYTLYGCDQEYGVVHFTVERLYEQIKNIRLQKLHSHFVVKLSVVDILPSGEVLDCLNMLEESHPFNIDLHSSVSVLDQVTKIDCYFASHAHELIGNAEAKRKLDGSHRIMSLHVESAIKNSADDAVVPVCGRFDLVDLAPWTSEIQHPSKDSVGDEGLKHLRQVVMKQGDAGSSSLGEFPLTCVLRDMLAGNCKTVMIAHITTAYMELVSTSVVLRFAEKVRKLVNHPIVNRRPDGDLAKHEKNYLTYYATMKNPQAATPERNHAMREMTMLDQKLSGLVPGQSNVNIGGPSVKKMSTGRYSIGRRSSFAKPPEPPSDESSVASSSCEGEREEEMYLDDDQSDASSETLPPVNGSCLAANPVILDDLRDLFEDTPVSKTPHSKVHQEDKENVASRQNLNLPARALQQALEKVSGTPLQDESPLVRLLTNGQTPLQEITPNLNTTGATSSPESFLSYRKRMSASGKKQQIEQFPRPPLGFRSASENIPGTVQKLIKQQKEEISEQQLELEALRKIQNAEEEKDNKYKELLSEVVSILDQTRFPLPPPLLTKLKEADFEFKNPPNVFVQGGAQRPPLPTIIPHVPSTTNLHAGKGSFKGVGKGAAVMTRQMSDIRMRPVHRPPLTHRGLQTARSLVQLTARGAVTSRGPREHTQKKNISRPMPPVVFNRAPTTASNVTRRKSVAEVGIIKEKISTEKSSSPDSEEMPELVSPAETQHANNSQNRSGSDDTAVPIVSVKQDQQPLNVSQIGRWRSAPMGAVPHVRMAPQHPQHHRPPPTVQFVRGNPGPVRQVTAPGFPMTARQGYYPTPPPVIRTSSVVRTGNQTARVPVAPRFPYTNQQQFPGRQVSYPRMLPQ